MHTEHDKFDAFAAAAAALTKSGTSTLELAMAGVPMLVAYRVNPLSASIARHLVTVSYASILNLIAGHQIVPELLQERCTSEGLAAALLPLLQDAQAASAQREASQAVLTQLAPPNGSPSQAAAAEVLGLLDQA